MGLVRTMMTLTLPTTMTMLNCLTMMMMMNCLTMTKILDCSLRFVRCECVAADRRKGTSLRRRALSLASLLGCWARRQPEPRSCHPCPPRRVGRLVSLTAVHGLRRPLAALVMLPVSPSVGLSLLPLLRLRRQSRLQLRRWLPL